MLIRKSLGSIAPVARAQIVQTASVTKEGLMSESVSEARSNDVCCLRVTIRSLCNAGNLKSRRTRSLLIGSLISRSITGDKNCWSLRS